MTEYCWEQQFISSENSGTPVERLKLYMVASENYVDSLRNPPVMTLAGSPGLGSGVNRSILGGRPWKEKYCRWESMAFTSLIWLFLRSFWFGRENTSLFQLLEEVICFRWLLRATESSKLVYARKLTTLSVCKLEYDFLHCLKDYGTDYNTTMENHLLEICPN